MTADIVNLRQARKRKARADDAQRAAERRVLFGRTKEEKAAAQSEAAGNARRLDGHRLDPAAKPRSRPEE